MNLESYMQQKFPNAKISAVSSNGRIVGYYAQGRGQGVSVYVPISAVNNTNVNMVSYLPGSGGAGNDAKMLRERISNNPPDYIISIASECNDKGNCIKTGYNVATELNSKVTNNVTVCFSASGFQGIQRTEEFLQEHPEVKNTVISSEPYTESRFRQNKATALAQSKTPIIFAAPDSGFHLNMMNVIKNMKSNGLNAYLLETDYSSNGHIMTNRDVLTSGMIEYVLGEANSFDTSRAGGYEFFKADEASGKIVKADYNEIAGGTYFKIPDINSFNSFDGHKIETLASPVNKKYEGLKSLEPLKNSAVVELSSDYGMVADHMDNIRSLIKSSSFLNGVSNLSFRSSSGIPGCISAYINAYYDIVGSLLNSISMETESVTSYAEAVVRLDKELAQEENKGKQGTIITKDNSSKFIAIGLEEQEENKTEEQPTEEVPTAVQQETPSIPTTSSTTPTTSTSSSTPVIPVTPSIPSTEPDKGPCYDETRTPDYVLKLEGYDAYFYIKDNKVIGFKYRYTFASAEESANKLAEIKEKYKESTFIKEIISTNQYVDVIFKDESIENKSVDDIVQQFIKGGK